MSASNSEENYERAYFKRKSSVHPMALDVRNSDEYYCARSSNGRLIISDRSKSSWKVGWSSGPFAVVSQKMP